MSDFPLTNRRDYFAGQILQGLVANPSIVKDRISLPAVREQLANEALAIADSLVIVIDEDYARQSQAAAKRRAGMPPQKMASDYDPFTP